MGQRNPWLNLRKDQILVWPFAMKFSMHSIRENGGLSSMNKQVFDTSRSVTSMIYAKVKFQDHRVKSIYRKNGQLDNVLKLWFSYVVHMFVTESSRIWVFAVKYLISYTKALQYLKRVFYKNNRLYNRTSNTNHEMTWIRPRSKWFYENKIKKRLTVENLLKRMTFTS